MKILLSITGASLATIGLTLLENLIKFSDAKLYAIVSDGAKVVLEKENNFTIDISNYPSVTFFDDKNLYSAPASGSFQIDKTIIAPCSMNTLAKISSGISDTLTTRAAAVALKERRELILAPREMPYSTISLSQMTALSKLGAIIAPPVLGGYSGAINLEQMQKFIVGKWLDLLGVRHEIYKRWS